MSGSADAKVTDKHARALTESNLTYRADIDGLRAISVLAVIGFHAFPGLVRGGFVGVDVFFVISGFLISGIIFAELEKNKFSFFQFYARRVRRIFPALAVMLATCYAIGWLVLFPEEYARLGSHIAGAAGFVANLIFLRESGYFDAAAAAKPLLHLWSLGVEEQFYIVWPSLIWIAWRRKIDVLTTILVISAASFLVMLAAPSRAVAFYSPLTRFWELMAGSMLAYACTEPRSWAATAVKTAIAAAKPWLRVCAGPHGREIAATAGALLIGVAILKTPAAHFPGLWTLLPVTGACLVIAAGAKARVNARVLARPALVKLGLISYPLYLWHWPLLSYASIIDGGVPPIATRLTLIAASVLLAYLTYVAIETLVRFGLHRAEKSIALCGIMIVVACAGYMTNRDGGLAFRPVAHVNQIIANDLKVPTGSRTSDASCANSLGIDPVTDEVCLASGPHPHLLVIGDSQAMAFNSAVYAGLASMNTVLVSTNMDVWEHPPCLKNLAFDAWLEGQATCVSVIRHALAIASRVGSVSTVVIAFQNADPFFLDREKMGELQKRFRVLHKTVIYLLDVPIFRTPPSACKPRIIDLVGVRVSQETFETQCRQERTDFETMHAATRRYLVSLADGRSDILVYDPLPAFCDRKFCYEADDQGVLYWTTAHVNERGSARLLKDFVSWSKRTLPDSGS